MHCCCKFYLVTTLLLFGLISVVVSVFALFFLPNLLNKVIREQYHLGYDQNGTDNNILLKMYRDPPYDVKMQIWIISVLNPGGVVAHGEKPNVTEIGPFTYDVHLHKTNVTFARNGTRMFYRNVKSFFFNANKSCSGCSLKDKVTVPNIVFQKIVDVLKQNPIWIPLVELFLKGTESVFITVSVEELLFKGYKDKLLSGLCQNPLTKGFCEKNNVPDRIGLFYGQNNTDDGVYEVDTGLDNMDRIGHVYSWNGMDGKLDGTHWYSHTARMIRGTDAELFRPNLYNESKLQIYFGEFCRSFDLKFQKSTIFSDLPVRRFIQPDSLMSADTQRHQGFCNPQTPDYFHNETIQEAGCAPSGLLDMSSCLPGQPRMFLSQGHFLGASQSFRDTLVGMPPPTDEDVNFYDIEPLTGTAVHVQQRMQLNVGMLKGGLSMTRRMRDQIVPIIWMNQLAVVDPGTKQQLLLPLTILRVSRIVGILLGPIGALLLLAALVLIIFFRTNHWRRNWHKKKGIQAAPKLTTIRSFNSINDNNSSSNEIINNADQENS